MFKNNGSQNQASPRKLPALSGPGGKPAQAGPRPLPSLKGYSPQAQNAEPLSYGEFLVRIQLFKVVDTDKPKNLAVVVEFDIIAAENASPIEWKDNDGHARCTPVAKAGQRRMQWFDMLDKTGYGYGQQELVGILCALGASEDEVDA